MNSRLRRNHISSTAKKQLSFSSERQSILNQEHRLFNGDAGSRQPVREGTVDIDRDARDARLGLKAGGTYRVADEQNSY